MGSWVNSVTKGTHRKLRASTAILETSGKLRDLAGAAAGETLSNWQRDAVR
jgi:hypothetical protein